MKQNKTAPEASVTPSVAELQKLTPTQAALNFVAQTTAAVRAFIVAAKLLIVLEPTLKPGQTLGGVIVKLANVPTDLRRRVKSTIDNGRQAMRVWKELVEAEHITEAVFDGFTFGDFISINRVMSGASRQKLTATEVSMVIKEKPKNWHEELDCLFNYGQTLTDRAAADAKKEASKKPAESGTSTDEPAAPGSAPASGATEGASSPESSDTPSEPADGKVVPFKAPAKPTVDDAFKLIDALEAVFGELDAGDVAQAAPRLAELNALVQAAATAKPARKAAKQKAARRPKTAKAA